MTGHGILEIVLFCLTVTALTKPLGVYMHRVFEGQPTALSRAIGPVERVIYRLLGVRESDDMRWTQYSFALLAFSAVGMLLTYVLLRLQGALPLNPRGFGGGQMPPDLAFGTAASFATNTNWQSYVPEASVSTLSNMLALTVQNWTSAAAGMAVAVAVCRGFARHGSAGIGNFWVDLIRACLYILLPICIPYALFLVWQGVPQTFAAPVVAAGLDGSRQTLLTGPVASQEAIKMLGTNGGGFFNANSAHPFENPTPLTNFVQIVSIFAIPAALTCTFGRMVGNPRQGWAIFGAMAALFLCGLAVCYQAETAGVPAVRDIRVAAFEDDAPGAGNMEGKEVRFGIAPSALFATVTTAASCGAVNSMHDSYTPLGGMVALLNILCDETVFGGVGAGLFGMLMYAIVAVFIAGLMVGRTPEYLGKKIGKYEVRMAILALLILFATAASWTALACTMPIPPSAAALNRVNGSSPALDLGGASNNVGNPGAHGFSELLYAYASQTGNNGSAFAGLTANTPYYNLTGGIAMLVGRFLMIIPLLAMSGSLARKQPTPASAGSLATDTPTFAFLLAGVVLVVGALEYFPALALGPIAENLQMLARQAF
ncbi:MAG: potassium-transporting ATPase subunit KdpA [Armatimonadetes bacterium]|nr:potassium-transporting ATPase subunit KdpA [Armatimonadota bacterium]